MAVIQDGRKDWCDLARGFLMFLVFVYHSKVYYGDEHTWSWIFMPFFLPGFIFISGYLFCSNLSKVDFQSKCLQVVRTILIPYLCFMTIFFIPKVLFILDDSRQQFIDILLFRASWFVVVIGVLQILYGMILSKYSIIKLTIYTCLMFSIGYIIVVVYRFRPEFIFQSIWLESHQLPGRLPLCINLALILSPFFMFGILYRQFEKYIKIPVTWSFLILLMSIYSIIWSFDHFYIGSYAIYAVNSFNNILLIFFYALVAIVCVIVASKLICKITIFNYIGKHSLIFYYFNGVVLTLLVKVNNQLCVFVGKDYWKIVLFAILSCLLCFPICYCINRWVPFLEGSKSSYNRLSIYFGFKIRW